MRVIERHSPSAMPIRTTRIGGHRVNREDRNACPSALSKRRGIKHEVLNAKQHAREAQIIAQAGKPGRRDGGDEHGRPRCGHRCSAAILRSWPESEMKQAWRRSRRGSVLRRARLGRWSRNLLPQTQVDQANKCWRPAGCMCVGTERHESRRIDNQLRGRSGRQGDPGESRFYLSLEDDLMRRFARVNGSASIMGRLKIPARRSTHRGEDG